MNVSGCGATEWGGMANGTSEFRPEDELPEGLREELRGLYSPPTRMPAGRDEGILAAARRAGGGRRIGWKRAVGMAMAACVAVAGTLFVMEWGWRGERGEAKPAASAIAAGYVRTGDIRDAFYLARELAKESPDGKKRGAGLPAFWDANRDGVVDQGDVNALAVAAVALPVERNGGVR